MEQVKTLFGIHKKQLIIKTPKRSRLMGLNRTIGTLSFVTKTCSLFTRSWKFYTEIDYFI